MGSIDPAGSDGRDVVDRFRIGATPLVALKGFDFGEGARVTLKAEYANPFGSVKDRAAAYLLAWATRTYGPDVRLVESTSGNLGVALGYLAAGTARLTIVMDTSIPQARWEAAKASGADVVVVDRARSGLTQRETRIAAARELGDRPGHVWLNQYGNAEGVRAHRETTGSEILADAGADLHAVVASVGTGATICGIGQAVRHAGHRATVIGVEPVGSTIAGGEDGDYLPAGAGMRGPSDLVRECGDVIDRFAQVTDAAAAWWALAIRSQLGVAVGLTTGAAVAAAADVARCEGGHVIAIAADACDVFLPAMRRLAASFPDHSEHIRWIAHGPYAEARAAP